LTPASLPPVLKDKVKKVGKPSKLEELIKRGREEDDLVEDYINLDEIRESKPLLRLVNESAIKTFSSATPKPTESEVSVSARFSSPEGKKP
jgi:hypothetical protein